MESHNYLGIYLRPDRATVVCVAGQGRDRKLLGCFSVLVEGQPENVHQFLAERIAAGCTDRGMKFGQAVVALDCSLFMQHAVHSEFSEYKKVAATVRFDTEEALAMDVADVAVAFRIISSDENGSNLDVFTTPRGTLTDILLALQNAGIDPIVVDPDSYCLSRYLAAHGTSGESPEHASFYALLSDSRGYLLAGHGAAGASTIRAFPISAAQNRTSLLAREILITAALAETTGRADQLRLFDVKGEVAADPLAEKIGRAVTVHDPVQMAGAQAGPVADCADPVDFAIAYGAALTPGDKERGINFRNDHMPYQGEKVRMNRALKFLSIAVTILILSVGVYCQALWMQAKADGRAMRATFEPDYIAVMMAKAFPKTANEAWSKLDKALRELKAEKGIEGVPQESTSSKLTLVLLAINSCASQTGLKVDTVTVSSKTIHINGSTTSRRNTNSVFETMGKYGLKVADTRVTTEGNRDNFDMTVAIGLAQKAAEKEKP